MPALLHGGLPRNDTPALPGMKDKLPMLLRYFLVSLLFGLPVLGADVTVTLKPTEATANAKWRLIRDYTVATGWLSSGATANVDAGTYRVECTHIPGYDTPTASILSEGSNVSQTLTYLQTSAPPTTVTGYSSGVGFSYYSSSSDLYGDYSTLTPGATGSWPNIYLSDGQVDSLAGSIGQSSSNIHLVFTGEIYFPAAGAWTIYSNSDDHSRVYLGTPGQTSVSTQTLVVDRPCCGEGSGIFEVSSPGWYPFTVQWQNGTGGRYIYLSWSSATTAKQAIPDANYRRANSYPLLSPAAGSAIWHAGPDWVSGLLGSNPASPTNTAVPAWAYGYVSENSSSFNLFSASDLSTNAWGFVGFALGGTYPMLRVYPGLNTREASGAGWVVTIPANALWTAPASNGNAPAVRWTAPYTGDFDISATWSYAESPACGDGYVGLIWRGGGTLYNSGANQSTKSFTTSVTLQGGETLLFVTQRNGNYYCDSVALDVMIRPAQVALTVDTVPNGTATPEGTSSVSAGAPVSLSATPVSGYSFAGWTVISGSVLFENKASANTTAYLATNATIAPVFVAGSHTLTVTVSGNGTVTPQGGNYAPGFSQLITATPAPGHYFAGWTGPNAAELADATAPSFTLFMDSNKVLTANFIAGQSGDVTVHLQPAEVASAVRWQLSNTQFTSEWYASGATAPAVPPGTYNILFDRARVETPAAVYSAPALTPTLTVGGFAAISRNIAFPQSVQPAGIPNLMAWYRADAIAAIGTWPDSSGNNFTLSKVTPTDPLLVSNAVNGKPAVRFGGSAYYKTTGGNLPTNGSSLTIFLVEGRSAGGNNQAISFYGTPTSETGFAMGYEDSVTAAANWRDSSTRRTISAAVPGYSSTQFASWTLVSQPNSQSLLRNGSVVAVTSYPGPLLSADRAFYIGGGYATNFVGEVAEVLIYGRALSVSERLTVEAYLHAKYFQPPQHILTVTTTAGGAVTPGGSTAVQRGVPVGIVATPAVGYAFLNWTISNGEVTFADASAASTTVTLTADSEIRASFVPRNYNLTVNTVNGALAQSVTSYPANSTQMLGASPVDENFVFDHWSGPDAASLSSTTLANPTIVMTSDKTVTANFVRQYTLSLAANPPGGGSITPATGSRYRADTLVTLTATPAPGHSFVGWTGNVADPNAPTTSVLMSSDQTITANFVAHTYNLAITSSPSVGGTTSPSGAAAHLVGSTINLSASPSAGYVFGRWLTLSGASVANASDASTSLVLASDTELQATFLRLYDLTLTAGPGGTVTPSGTVPAAETSPISVRATPSTGYRFSHWTGNTEALATAVAHPEALLLMPSSNAALQAVFLPVTYTLTLAAQPGGTVTPAPGTHTFPGGTPVLFSATADPGFAFVRWEGDIAALANPLTASQSVLITQDLSLTAKFTATYTLVATASPGGTVTPPGTSVHHAGSIVALTATPAAGYVFGGWSGPDAGALSSQGTATSIPLDANRSVHANFTRLQFTLTPSATEGGTTSPAAATQVPAGDTIVLTATPGPGFVFTGWTGPGAEGLSANERANPSLPLVMHTDRALTANFGVARSLLVTASPGGTVSPSGTRIYADGAVVTVVATPEPNYQFTGWSGPNAGELSVNAATTSLLVAGGNKGITANFSIQTHTVVISAGPGGTVSPEGTRSYNRGTTLSVTANPAAGYIFTGWSGSSNSSSPSLGLTIDGDKSLTAHFAPVRTLTVTTTAGGTVSPSGTSLHADGAIVQLNATPAPHYRFTGWSGTHAGELSHTGPAPTLSMSGDKVVHAAFAVITHSVTLAATGPGTVTARVNGALVGTSGQTITLPQGSTLSLEAAPETGAILSQWSGATLPATASVSLTIDRDYSLSAIFIPGYSLTTSASAGGTVVPLGTTTAAAGSSISVTATPASGYVFDRWSGAAAGTVGTGPSVTVSLHANTDLRAEFIEAFYLVTVSAGANGSVTPAAPVTWRKDSVLEITATAQPGYVFREWQGDIQVLNPGDRYRASISLAVTRDTALHAVFALARTLTVTATNGGQATPAGTQTVADGTVVAVSAPATFNGRTFNGWSGDTYGTIAGDGGRSLQVVMDRDRTLTAEFVLPQVKLTIGSSGPGSVSPAGVIQVAAGQPVDIALHPDAGSMFLSAAVNGNPDTEQFDAQNLLTGVLRRSYSVDSTIEIHFSAYHTVAIDSQGQGQVRVTATPPSGSVAPITADFDAGTASSRRFPSTWTLALTPHPAPNWVFDRFAGPSSGELSGTAGPANLTNLNADKALTATFRRPDYSLTVSSAGNGLVSPSGTSHYPAGTAVVAYAQPDPGYVFAGWSGDATSTNNPITHTVSADQHLVANFAPAAVLTLGASAGGTVTPGIGTFTYPINHAVTVGAVPAAGFKFDRWTGAGVPPNQSASPTLVLTLTGGTQLYAVFSKLLIDVEITAGEHGSVSPSGTVSLAKNQTLTVTATAEPGFIFAQWEGTAASVLSSGELWSSSVSLTPGNADFPSPLSLRAKFVPGVTLTGTAAGQGQLKYAQTGSGLFAPLNGTVPVIAGDTYDIQAVPAPHYRLGAWSADAEGMSGTTISLTVSTERTVGVSFVPILYKVCVSGTSGGAVTPAGNSLVQSGTPHTVSARPDEGFVLLRWEIQQDTTGLNDTSAITRDLVTSQISPSPTLSQDTRLSLSSTIDRNVAYRAVFAPKATLFVSAATGGTVTAAGYGNCVPQLTVPRDTVVTLTPQASAGFQFERWEGADAAALTRVGASWILAMGADRYLTPVFQILPKITVEVPHGTALIEGTGLSIDQYPAEGNITAYTITGQPSQAVYITVVPKPFVTFQGWVGKNTAAEDELGASHTARVTMAGTKSLRAQMTLPSVSLTLGPGVEYSTNLGAAATFNQSAAVTVPVGTRLQVRAVVPSGTAFGGWTGDTDCLDSQQSPTFLTASRNLQLDARATTKTATLTVFLIGGTQAVYSTTVAEGTAVSLLPVAGMAAPGNSFVRWSGLDATALNSPSSSPTTDRAATILLSTNRQVTAIFAPSYTLSVTAAGNGTVNHFGASTWQQGAVVPLTPIPAPGFAFSGWSGPNAAEISQAAALLMDGNKAVQANFAPATYNVTISTTNGNTPEVTYTYGANTLVNLTAATINALAAPGYSFALWSGPDANLLASTSRADGTFLLTHNVRLHANFAATLNLAVSASAGGTVIVEKVPTTP